MSTQSYKTQAAAFFREMQEKICSALETADGKVQRQADAWDRADARGGSGGGGLTFILKNGNVFEQGGVNFSEVHGSLPPDMTLKLLGSAAEAPFYATGISLVMHPHSPLVPSVHANFRYLEVGDKKWFGGGTDLTPHVLFEEDAAHFHLTLKAACDAHQADYYPRFKRWCDEYFFLPHRGETRGVGGIFFDYLGKEEPSLLPGIFAFVQQAAESFIPAYLPVVNKRKSSPWTEQQKEFQLLRRGRYVEFNLLYDRGTLFGLRTGGRIESIFMSLPPNVRWEYNQCIVPGSAEARLLDVLKAPREWV